MKKETIFALFLTLLIAAFGLAGNDANEIEVSKNAEYCIRVALKAHKNHLNYDCSSEIEAVENGVLPQQLLAKNK